MDRREDCGDPGRRGGRRQSLAGARGGRDVIPATPPEHARLPIREACAEWGPWPWPAPLLASPLLFSARLLQSLCGCTAWATGTPGAAKVGRRRRTLFPHAVSRSHQLAGGDMGQMSRRTKAATVGPHQPRVIDGLCPPQWSGPVGAGPPAPGSSSPPLPPKSGAEPRPGWGLVPVAPLGSLFLALALSVSCLSLSLNLSVSLNLSFNLSISLNLNLSFSLRPPLTFYFSKAALRSPLPRKSPSAVGRPD